MSELYGHKPHTDRLLASFEAQDALRASIRDNGHLGSFDGAVQSLQRLNDHIAVIQLSGDESFRLVDLRSFLDTGELRLALDREFSSPESAAEALPEIDHGS